MAITTAANGIEIGRRALQAQQTAIQVVSHNIANVNTPGFSRRRAEMVNAESGVPGGVGSGADVVDVVRLRSAFLDAQFRVEQQVRGRWEAVEGALTGIEAIFNEPAGAGSSEAGSIFNEPSGLGLSGSLSRFWNAWQDLANVPESGAARAAVRQEGEFLSNTLHQQHQQLSDTRVGLDDEIVREVGEINAILEELASLNAEMPLARIGGTAGDLEDIRDNLIERLSEKVDITLIANDNGQVSVLLSGHNLIQATSVVELGVRTITQGDFPTSTVFFTDDGSLASIREGRLRGLTEVRDQTLPDFMGRLDALASAMVEEINRLHRAGTGFDGVSGRNFFDPTNTAASNITLSTDIREDLNRIAAFGDGNTGDNGTALGISALRNQRVLGSGTETNETIEEFFYTLLGEVGSQSKAAQTMAQNHRLFTTQIENRRQAFQGVSLNDEAAQLILFQRAYQAAARMVSVVDELMEIAVGL